VTLGTGAATALGNLALQVEDSVSRELRRFGANLVILPAGGSGRTIVGGVDITGSRVPVWLDAARLPAVKDNFWKNNILDFAPELDAAAGWNGRPVTLRGGWFERTGPDGRTGWKSLSPDWQLEGSWPEDDPPAGAPVPVIVGSRLAARTGAVAGAPLELRVGATVLAARVTGILSSGEEADDMILAPLQAVQDAAGLPGRLDRVRVSALTTPENEFARRMGVDLSKVSPEDLEKWNCTPFVSSIAHELSRAWPGTEVLAVRRVAETEGRLLERTGGLMALIAIVAAFSAALTVASALTTSVLERRREIGLFKALGSGTGGVLGVFLAEAAAIGIMGGCLGALLGAVLSSAIRRTVFETPGEGRPHPILLPAASALVNTLPGSALPPRRLIRLRAAEALRG
jgi:putative ABC transport system permease protein